MQNPTGPIEYTLELSQLNITAEKVIAAMGYPADTAPEEIIAETKNTLLESLPFIKVKAGFLIFSKNSIKLESPFIHVNKVSFNLGKLIAAQLRECNSVAFFTTTAGPLLGNWSQELMKQGDMIKGYVVDTIGSEIAEAAADEVSAKIEKKAKEFEYSVTNRYSPGYCGWHVTEQKKLFGFLPPEFCGITLTESSLMMPIKSVSGLIGIGKNAVKKEYGCSLCTMEQCFRRKK